MAMAIRGADRVRNERFEAVLADVGDGSELHCAQVVGSDHLGERGLGNAQHSAGLFHGEQTAVQLVVELRDEWIRWGF